MDPCLVHVHGVIWAVHATYSGVWCMVYGVWCMLYGVLCMVYGACYLFSTSSCSQQICKYIPDDLGMCMMM